VGLAGMHFLDFSGLACVGQGSKDLHVNEIALANLDLHPVVSAGDYLLSDSHGSEVSDSCTELCNDLVLKGADHDVFLLSEA